MTPSNNVMLCLVFRKQNLALCDKSNKKTAFDAVFFTYFYVKHQPLLVKRL